MKTTIQDLFQHFSPEEKETLTALPIICSEGVSVGVACEVLAPENPINFYQIVNGLTECNLLYREEDTIECYSIVKEGLKTTFPLTVEAYVRILSSLQRLITLRPLDDMYEARDYFKVARLFLLDMMESFSRGSLSQDERLVKLYAECVIAFARNSELSYADKRQRMYDVSSRDDFRLLQSILTLRGQPYKGEANVLLGDLHSRIFNYENARSCFRKAKELLGQNAELMIAEAMMFYNLSIYWKAYQLLYSAYLLNKAQGRDDDNISTCLFLSHLCALNRSEKSAELWGRRAQEIVGSRVLPQHHAFLIYVKEIEALLSIDKRPTAISILEKAELEALRLYGARCPELSTVHFIRQEINTHSGFQRESVMDYRSYVETNHYNYGYSPADTMALYSSYVAHYNTLESFFTSNYYTHLMQSLESESTFFAPGVRINKAFANFYTYIVGGEQKEAEHYLDEARKIYREEIMIDADVATQIAPIFHDGVIPEDVEGRSLERIIHQCESLLLRLRPEGGSDMRHIQKMIAAETNPLERQLWQVRMGRVLATGGDKEGAVKLWREILEGAAKKDKFCIGQSISECAQEQGMAYEARDFLEIALYFDNIVYASTRDMAEALKSYAQILKYLGLQGSEEPWEEAERLMQSIGDLDGLSTLYFTWGLFHYDDEAVRLFQKAISLWKPERGPFDEHLSNMYFSLTLALASVGRHDEARSAAKKAVKLFPDDYPPYLAEQIEEYL